MASDPAPAAFCGDRAALAGTGFRPRLNYRRCGVCDWHHPGQTLGTGHRNSRATALRGVGRVASPIKLPEAYAESVIGFDC
jgi:hypothetical protein